MKIVVRWLVTTLYAVLVEEAGLMVAGGEVPPELDVKISTV